MGAPSALATERDGKHITVDLSSATRATSSLAATPEGSFGADLGAEGRSAGFWATTRSA